MDSKKRTASPTNISGRPASPDIPVRHSPSHQEIADYAHNLWHSKGRPHSQDLEIWLEAEKKLKGASGSGDLGNSASDDLGKMLGDGEMTDSMDVRVEELGGRAPERSTTSL
jgi:hypothetical protein